MAASLPGESHLEDTLTRIPLFAEIDRVALAQLAAHLDPIELQEGDTVCRQGEPGDCLYLLTSGRLGVHVHEPEGGASRRIDSLGPGDFFGEMALLTGEPRSATIRAEMPSRVLRLDRERFEALVRAQPSSFLAIARVLSRRLAAANRMRIVEEQALAAGVEASLDRLSPDRREAVLEASLLEEPAALAVLAGDRSDTLLADLAALGVGREGGTVVRDILRDRLLRDDGPARVRRRAEVLSMRLAAAGQWDAALGVRAAHGDAQSLATMLARALRATPPLAPERARQWIERLGDEAALGDADLALARATFHETRGNPARALDVLRRALGGALRGADHEDGARLGAEISRLALAVGEHPVADSGLRPRITGEAPLPHGTGWPGRVCLVAGGILTIAAAWPAANPQRTFVLLLLAAIATMLSRRLPDFVVGLGLVAGWIVLGVAKPAEALAGFASRGMALRAGRVRTRRRHGALGFALPDRSPPRPARPAGHAAPGGDAPAERSRPDAAHPVRHRPGLPGPAARARAVRGASDPGPLGRLGPAGARGLDRSGPAHVRGAERVRHVLARLGPPARGEPRSVRVDPVADRGLAARPVPRRRRARAPLPAAAPARPWRRRRGSASGSRWRCSVRRPRGRRWWG